MEYFDIGGSCTIHGEITPSGNKNEALPVIAASLLCSEPVQIDNVPDILDVRNMLKIAAAWIMLVTQKLMISLSVQVEVRQQAL